MRGNSQARHRTLSAFADPHAEFRAALAGAEPVLSAEVLDEIEASEEEQRIAEEGLDELDGPRPLVSLAENGSSPIYEQV